MGFIDRFRRLCGGSRTISTLIGVNIVIGVILWTTSAVMRMTHHDPTQFAMFMALPSSFAEFIRHPWTLATYMVTQFSLLHLLFNVLWLYWFGQFMLISAAEMSNRSRERNLLMIYAGGGLAGGMAYILASLCGASAGAYLCGASASVLAIMSVVALKMPDYEITLFLIGRVKVKWFAIICILITLIGTGGASAAGSVAHLGGIAFGVFHSLRDKITRPLSLFTPRKKMNVKAMVKASQGRLSDSDRLDELLDKIRLSGFDSLTERERKELNALSARLRQENK